MNEFSGTDVIKYYKQGSFKKQKVFLLIIPETRRLKSRYWMNHAPFEKEEKILPCFFLASNVSHPSLHFYWLSTASL
jgi:hypothetical protein